MGVLHKGANSSLLGSKNQLRSCLKKIQPKMYMIFSCMPSSNPLKLDNAASYCVTINIYYIVPFTLFAINCGFWYGSLALSSSLFCTSDSSISVTCSPELTTTGLNPFEILLAPSSKSGSESWQNKSF